MATYDIRIGDVYHTCTGGIRSGEDNLVNAYPFVGEEVQLLRDGMLRWLTCKYVATRMALVQRDGVRVGDVYRYGIMRASDCRVVRLVGDDLVVESVYGTPGEHVRERGWLKNRTLVERDGRAVVHCGLIDATIRLVPDGKAV